MSNTSNSDEGVSTPPALSPRLDADEVIRRFPEVRDIDDPVIRAHTTNALRYTPDYFWDVPASTSGKYHHPLARGKHGLWIHTKMAIAAYEELVESNVKLGVLSEHEADCGRAAVLLHDQFKQGYPDDRSDDPNNQHTVGNHDVLAADWFRQHTDLPSPIVDAVEAHNGPWGDGQNPEDELGRLVHMCDMFASRPTITVELKDPAQELLDEYPDLPTQS